MKPHQSTRFQNSLHQILDDAIEADYAVLGNIQFFSDRLGVLQIVAQRGFDLAFLQYFENVRVDDGCACGRAFAERRRVMVSDITEDFDFAPHLSIARASGFCAVQSTPFFQHGVFRGVLSTHFPDVHHLSGQAIATLDRCAADIVALLEVELEPA